MSDQVAKDYPVRGYGDGDFLHVNQKYRRGHVFDNHVKRESCLVSRGVACGKGDRVRPYPVRISGVIILDNLNPIGDIAVDVIRGPIFGKYLVKRYDDIIRFSILGRAGDYRRRPVLDVDIDNMGREVSRPVAHRELDPVNSFPVMIAGIVVTDDGYRGG